ncbi:MAG: hypothetical protein V1899_08895 [Planctomycetota bacterium]
MAITVKQRCSECGITLKKELKSDAKEISCVACGRRMANLPASDYAEMEKAQKSQRTFGIIAVALFVIAIVFVFLWVGDSGGWVSGKIVGADGTIAEASGAIESNMGPMIVAAVCALASLVLGIIASLKRFVVEF